ncbi:hypothetical protein [Bacillus cereus]|uniref:hypothetical protein n=1 Tax=Bacillus cereus TaxID=1396 RepID=UPI000976716E|nr:hypothetical protein [Bacillus cereus]ONH02510.1 hypothetical protein BKK45_02885 [Bacillus cereus]PFU91673.1 hypothetical protein COK92_18545 [Bacillus anthracis]
MARKGIYMKTNKKNINKLDSFSINLAPSRRRIIKVQRKRYASSGGTIEDIITIFSGLLILIPVLLLLIWLFPKFFALVGIGLATWGVYEIGYRIYSSWERD